MTEEYVATTQELFQNLITKPKLSEKYLKRPPFRFIHDIVTNTMKATGFPQGLFEGDELNGKLIKEKQDKISWLNKLIKCIESVTNEPLNAKPTKIVAGIEPEYTNQMLQAFGNIAINVQSGELSMENILNNMNPTNENIDNNNNSENVQTENNDNDTQQQQSQPSSRPPSGKPVTKTSNEDWIAETQETLGKLIDRPRLLEKLLKRPPFRFLHDIIKSLIKSTGYPLQFLDESKDINNANIKDAKFKYQFLAKLILIVSATMDQDLSFVDPKNIIAGRKPEDTNYLLTQLAYAAMKEINVDEIKQKMSVISGNNKKKKQEQAKQQEPPKEPPKKVEEKKPPQNDTPNDKPNDKSNRSGGRNTARKNAPIMPKLELEQLQNVEKVVNANKNEEQQQQVMAPPKAGQPETFQAVQKLQRPRTARRAPPKLKTNVIEEQRSQNEVKNNLILMDNDGSNENEHSGNNTMDNDMNEEEKQRMSMELTEETELERLGFISNNNRNNVDDVVIASDGGDGHHGKLVRDILDAQSGIKLDTMRLGTHRKDSAKSVERMENMREMIQKLCQTCLPLGKCIDLVFEDVESINNELVKWKQLIIKNKTKLQQEKEKTNQILNPLQKQLDDIEHQIKLQNQLILQEKAVLLKNETKTNEIIHKTLLND